MSRPAVFLDRDGTVNVEKEYLHRVEDWEWIPGAIEAIRLINQMGYLAIVVTNQAGVARGFYGEKDIEALHAEVSEILKKNGAKIDGFYYCPHHPNYGVVRKCSCRKPGAGMLLEAQKQWNIDLSQSFLIGDKFLDVEAAKAAGVTPILVLTGYGGKEVLNVHDTVLVSKDIAAAVSFIRRTTSPRLE